MQVTHFNTAADFRRWLEHQVGFYKKDSDKGGMTYQEAVDEALCFGWIDGIVRKINAVSYTHRFTPRKPRSIWSNVNVAHVARLTAPAGCTRPASRPSLRGSRKRPASTPSSRSNRRCCRPPA